MSANIIDGKEVARLMRTQIKQRITEKIQQKHKQPGLAVIVLGTEPASLVYVRNKREACDDVGIKSFAYDLSSDTTQEELLYLITQLNQNPDVHGILVQMPLPTHIDENLIVESIAPHKDVDGFHPYNLGRLAQRRPLLRPCTPYGIIHLLHHYKLPITGQHAVVVGASNIVGRPMTLELLLEGATVTTCHRFTQNLSNYISQADILIVAIGKRNIIASNMIKNGAVVIDVGIHRLKNGKLCGDIDFATAKKHASWITPVPGGVGPMTVTILMQNTLLAAEKCSNN